MKKILYGALIIMSLNNQTTALTPASEKVFVYKEMAVTFNNEVVQEYNSLSAPERVLAYYMYRAALPGNKIATDQIHRHGLKITALFEELHNNKDKIDDPIFNKEIDTYLVYLWTNHGQYFERETSNEKRTPSRLGLSKLTPANIIEALKKIKSPLLEDLESVSNFIFDEKLESTATIPGSIEQSAVNIYADGFTEGDYQKIPPQERSKINAYFYKDEKGSPATSIYSSNDKYSTELSESKQWLERAYDHAKQYPQHFDSHIISSLEYLIKFLETGDEELFKKHSIEWLKSDSKLDYCFGFIETYKDPKSHRGSFQAEVTVKSMNIKKLNAILPGIEKKLPIPAEFKRKSLNSAASIPNASINKIIFGSGDLGPTKIVAAYCLPNYDEIRSEHGSKQIIYSATKSIENKLNPALSRKLFNSKEHATWLDKVDPEVEFDNDMWNLQCILHETLGHGSGKLGQHTFKAGENLTISGKTYKPGDTISVTSANLPEFLMGYEQTLEELRAEIIALYVSLENLDQLTKNGFLTKWAQKMPAERLQKELVLHMAGAGYRRYIQQSDGATKISGDHARANCTIMNYFIEKGGIEKVKETLKHGGKIYTVIDLKIKDFKKAKLATKDLMIMVQQLKSTGDGLGVKNLIETYGIPLKDPENLRILKANRKAVVGDIKASALIFPKLIPVLKDNQIVDVKASWPKDIFEQYKHYSNL